MIPTHAALSHTLRPLARLGAAAALTLALAAPAWAGLSGATASGFASGDFRIGCTTCGHYSLTLTGDPAPVSGGPGAGFAAVDYTGTPQRGLVPLDYTLGGSAALAAMASYEGPLFSPRLRAKVMADNVPVFIIPDPAHVEIGIDMYQVLASAEAVQRYTFIGSESATFTWTFQVDGVVSNDLSSVGATAGFYDDFLESNLAFGSTQVDGIGLAGPVTPFNVSFDLTMTFNPGDSFYMRASLTALAQVNYRSGTVIANAYDTMRVVSITGGNTQLLVPTLQPVPEPGAAAMLLAGLAVLGACRTHRHRA